MAMVRQQYSSGTIPKAELARQPDAYICAKVLPPRLPARLVSRPRLLAQLAESLSKKLTLVQAPAGFGKTTLLCEWRRQLVAANAASVAWVTFDREDEEPKQVLRHIAQAIRRASSGRLDRTHALLATTPGASIRTIVSVVVNEIAEFDADVVLVLDDYETIVASAVHEAVHALLVRAPENLHVCIASRSRLPFQVAAWRAAREIVELDASALRFREDETRAFLDDRGRNPLVERDAHALCAATEGWVAGLALATMTSFGAGSAAQRVSTRRHTWTYLQENVLAELAPEILEFLLQTSILAQLSAELCGAVTGSARCAAVLEELAARNLFIVRLDETSTWFRYHALFREVLQAQLAKRDPSFVVALHRRAAHWLAENGAWTQAVKHAMAAGDVGVAEAWIERCAMSLVEAGDLHTLVHWSRKLPARSLRGRVALRFALAWTLPLLFRFAEGEAALEALEADDAAAIVALTAAERLELRAIRAMSVALADNHSVRAAALATACLEAMPPGDTWVHRIMRNVLTWAHTQHHQYAAARATQLELPEDGQWGSKLFAPTCRNGLLGMGWALQGRLSRAAALYGDVAAFAEKAGRYSAASTYLACFEAEIAYESNDLDGVDTLLVGRWETVDEACSLDAVLRAYVNAARVHVVRHDTQAALHVLDRGRAIGVGRDWHRLVCALDAERIRAMLIAGHRVEARSCYDELARRASSLPHDERGSPDRCREYCTVSLARLLIEESQYEPAIDLLRSAIEACVERRANLGVVRLSVLLAKALLRANRSPEAQPVLASALTFAGNENVIRSFLDEGREIAAPLLRALGAQPSGPSYSAARSRLLETLERSLSPDLDGESQPGEKVPGGQIARTIATLSAREQQILGCLAQGNQNKEIASLLRVSPETVKWHLKKIYEKLAVGSRTEATRLAMMSGLMGGLHETRMTVL